jgi:heat shock protein HtpX
MYRAIARNKRNTVLIILFFLLIIGALGWLANFIYGGGGYGILIAVLVIAALYALFQYYSATAQAVSMAGAVEIQKADNPRLWNIVENLSITTGTPMPKVYIVDDPAPNAFATGRNPKHAALAVTTGLLEVMNRVELEGVIAHELSHVKNYDILVTTIAVTAVGTIALISDIGLRFAFWGSLSGRRDNNGDSGPLGAVIAIASLAVLMLAPFAGYLMQMAMSRNREYLADASGVQLTRYPPGLISALEKLRDDHAVVHNATKATAQMWIEQPLETDDKKQGSKFNKLFDTHPPLEDRIKRLQEM